MFESREVFNVHRGERGVLPVVSLRVLVEQLYKGSQSSKHADF